MIIDISPWHKKENKEIKNIRIANEACTYIYKKY